MERSAEEGEAHPIPGNMANLSGLPSELIAKVSTYLDGDSLVRFGVTSRSIHTQANWVLYHREARPAGGSRGARARANRAIQYGSRKNIVATIVKAVEAGGSPDSLVVDRWGAPRKKALHEAIENHSVEAVKCLVELGADVHFIDHMGWTVLHLAQHPEIIRYLLEAGCAGYVNRPARGPQLTNTPFAFTFERINNSTAWHVGTRRGISIDVLAESAMIMLAYGADPNTGVNRMPVLSIAIRSAPGTGLPERLLSCGAGPEGMAPDWTTPLYYALILGASSFGMVDVLLRYGADANHDLWTPSTDLPANLMTPVAIATGDEVPVSVFRLLVERTADPNRRVEIVRRKFWPDPYDNDCDFHRDMLGLRSPEEILQLRLSVLSRQEKLQVGRHMKMALLEAAITGVERPHVVWDRAENKAVVVAVDADGNGHGKCDCCFPENLEDIMEVAAADSWACPEWLVSAETRGQCSLSSFKDCIDTCHVS